MLMPETKPQRQSQRIRVELDSDGTDKQVKIRLENHDESLGWYLSGSLTLSLPSLPLLEQAINEMRIGEIPDESRENKIVPFPGSTSRSNEYAGT